MNTRLKTERIWIIALVTLIITMIPTRQYSQSFQSFFAETDTLNKQRFWIGVGGSAATYTAFAVSLNQLWYADFEKSKFHLFNDWGEWENMDKIGHTYNAYFQSNLVYKGARWTGLGKTPSIWSGIGFAMLFQSTIEVLDGFSEEWGFSIPDMTYNIGGAALFGLQQHFWDEQRILLKVSSSPVKYPNTFITSQNGSSVNLQDRATDLYGSSFGSSFLKDYNAQTLWASVNVASFLPKTSRFPKWLNIAVGYGAENMYGGFENRWENGEDEFVVPSDLYPRHRQYYLSFDIDLSRIPVKNRFLKSILSMVNIIKIPSPTLRYSEQRNLNWYWMYF